MAILAFVQAQTIRRVSEFEPSNAPVHKLPVHCLIGPHVLVIELVFSDLENGRIRTGTIRHGLLRVGGLAASGFSERFTALIRQQLS
jgi:hypothetical protein